MVQSAASLPSALDEVDRIAAGLAPAPDGGGQRAGAPLLALDFDGTLTPIVEHADAVVLDPPAREILQRLCAITPVAVISGRDRADLERRVGLPVWYAGSHGFEISGPDGSRFEHRGIATADAALGRAYVALAAVAANHDGAWVERKPAAVALHYRQVDAGQLDDLLAAAASVVDDGLARRDAKMVLELRPALDWGKGHALRMLADELIAPTPSGVLFIGDDDTDEDALVEVRADGIGIVVCDHDRPTHARWRLRDPAEVVALLGRLADRLE